MKYEIWYRIFIVSGAASALLFILTLIFAVKFRFFELLGFRLQNSRNKSLSPELYKNRRTAELSSVTERISGAVNAGRGGITPDGTVIAGKSPDNSDGSFIITRNIIVINADPSVIE